MDFKGATIFRLKSDSKSDTNNSPLNYTDFTFSFFTKGGDIITKNSRKFNYSNLKIYKEVNHE